MAEAQDRHRTGSFYTPYDIAWYISTNAINARIKERLGADPETTISTGDTRTLKELYLGVLRTMRVLDPACGEGGFLRPCFSHLLSLRTRCLEALWARRCQDKRVKEDIRLLKKGRLGLSVLEDNIFGVDLKEDPVVKCREMLIDMAWKGRGSRRMAKVMEDNLRVGNSLLGFTSMPTQSSVLDFSDRGGEKDLDPVYLSFLAKKVGRSDMKLLKETSLFHWHIEFPEVMADGGFDVIIGNPPYGDRALTRSERSAVKAMFPFGTTVTDEKGKGSANPSSVFIERCHPLLIDGGQLALIVPSSVARVHEFEKLRAFILEHLPPWHIVDEGSPFEAITLEMVSLFSRKGRPKKDAKVEMISNRTGKGGPSWTVPLKVFRRYGRFMLYWDGIFDRISKKSSFGVLSGRRGPTVPRPRFKRNRDGSYPIPLLVSGKSIQRYRLVPDEFHWTQERALRTPELRSILETRILIGTRLTDRYRVCIKPPGFMVADNVIRIDHERSGMPPEALCVILNSRLMQHVVRRYLFNKSKLTLFIQSVAEATPIKGPADIGLFSRVGRMMLDLAEDWPNIKGTFEDMDRLVLDPLVYELYIFDGRLGLSERLTGLLEDPADPKGLIEKVQGDPITTGILDRIFSDPDVKRIEDEVV